MISKGDFIALKLPIVRQRLLELKDISDESVKDEIVHVCFDDDDINLFNNKDIDEILHTIFYKTRRRLGILEPLINDDDINEIMVNGPDKIFYEKNGIIERYKYKFDSVSELEEVMQAIAGDVNREINEMNPIVDARLLDGSRVNGVYKNIAVNGPILTIRKFSKDYINLDDLVLFGTINNEIKELLKILVSCGYNMFISGGTSSGKTTFLNAVSDAIPKDERVIVIEDSMELKLDYIENIVHMECRNANSKGQGKITMSDLIRSSLRMRPNRIIVGEVRGGEVVEMLSAMNTGHSGSLSTGHGNSVSGMLKRLESMYLMALPISIDAIRSQIAEGIDIMIHLERQEDGVRRVTEISELVDYHNNEYEINILYGSNSKSGIYKTGNKLVNDRKVRLKSSEYTYRLQQLGFI